MCIFLIWPKLNNLIFFNNRLLLIKMNSLNVIAFLFESRLKEVMPRYNIKLRIKIITPEKDGYNRCMARIYHLPIISKKPKIAIPDINKRCKRSAHDMCLCKLHIKKLRFGLVNEYPPEFLIDEYKEYDSELKKKINLNHKLFYSKSNCQNIKKNKIKDIVEENKKMSFETIEPKVEEILNKNFQASREEIYNNLLTMNIIDKRMQTLAEKNALLKKLDKKRKTYAFKRKKKYGLTEYIKSINIKELDCIKIIDKEYFDCDVFIAQYNDQETLITHEKNIVGEVRPWIDTEDEIPEEHKINNTVINPNNNMPIMEYVIKEGSNIYCNIESGIYREYEYNEDLESFMVTNNVKH